MVQLITARVLSDIEGPVFLKKRPLARKTRHFIRIHGGVLSVHANAKSAVSWDANLVGCTLRSLRRRSFTVALASGLSLFITLAQPSADADLWATVLRMASSRAIHNDYEIAEKVGEGAFATVHRAQEKASGETVAVKTIVKRQFDTTMARELDREVLACGSLLRMRLPGVIRTREVYNAQDKVHLVMDLMPGGTLKERVQSVGGRVPEAVAAPIVAATLRALAHLHRIGVAHRDIKLENVLCETATLPTTRTLLCDFGYVNFLEPGAETMRSLVGTPVYVAPEIVERRSYGAGVDVWATGIMTYRMISGKYPFDGGEDDEKTMQLIAEGDLQFPTKSWDGVSPECISFLRALLHPNPSIRLSAEGALHHRWLGAAVQVGSTVEQSAQTSIDAPSLAPVHAPSNAPPGIAQVAGVGPHEPSVPTILVSDYPDSKASTEICGPPAPSPAAVADLSRAFTEKSETKERTVQVLGDRLAIKASGDGLTTNAKRITDAEGQEHSPQRGALLLTENTNKSSTRAKFRLLVCMIVFQKRLQRAARLCRPLPQPQKGASNAIAPSVHPVQFAEDTDQESDVDPEESLMSSVSVGDGGAISAPPVMSSAVVSPGDKEIEAVPTSEISSPLPDRKGPAASKVEKASEENVTGVREPRRQEGRAAREGTGPSRSASIRRSAIIRTLSLGGRSNSTGRPNDYSSNGRFGNGIKRFMSISIASPRSRAGPSRRFVPPT